jgi:hypothetical protein
MTTKKHYTNKKYNAFANKPVKIPESKFNYRSERYRMERLCKKLKTPKELIQYFASNFALNTSDFLYQPEEYGETSYMRWESYKQSISYKFKTDVDFVVSHMENNTINFSDLMQTNMKLLLTLMIMDKITIQSVVLLDEVYNFLTSWVEDDTMNALYATHALRVQKTKGFIKYDKAIITNIARGLESVEYEQEQTV